ncbi:MAG: ABC transporter permease subunit [Theionarchaea archaeon]|nr:ABC transporter permease subunit [Theionarchaea archaeon]
MKKANDLEDALKKLEQNERKIRERAAYLGIHLGAESPDFKDAVQDLPGESPISSEVSQKKTARHKETDRGRNTQRLLSEAKELYSALATYDVGQAKRLYAELLKQELRLPTDGDPILRSEIEEYLFKIGKEIQKEEEGSVDVHIQPHPEPPALEHTGPSRHEMTGREPQAEKKIKDRLAGVAKGLSFRSIPNPVRMRRSNKIIIFIACIVFVGGWYGVGIYEERQGERNIPHRFTVENEFESPTHAANGLLYMDGYLWITSGYHGAILKYDLTTHEVVDSIDVPCFEATGLTFDGENFWVCDFSKRTIYQISPQGEVVSSYETPYSTPYGVAWDGANLWVLDVYSIEEFPDISGNMNKIYPDSVIYQYDYENDVILDEFKSPSAHSGDITFKDGEIVVVGDRKAFHITVKTRRVSLWYYVPDNLPRGITFGEDDTAFVSGMATPNIFEIDLNKKAQYKEVRTEHDVPVPLWLIIVTLAIIFPVFMDELIYSSRSKGKRKDDLAKRKKSSGLLQIFLRDAQRLASDIDRGNVSRAHTRYDELVRKRSALPKNVDSYLEAEIDECLGLILRNMERRGLLRPTPAFAPVETKPGKSRLFDPGLLRYVARRLVFLVPILLAVSFIVFILVYLCPGDAVDRVMGLEQVFRERPTMEEYLLLKKAWGLDQPWYIQYYRWLQQAVRGNLGFSFTTGQPVLSEILVRLPNTLIYQILALVLSTVIAVPLGIISAIHRNTRTDTYIVMGSLFGASFPEFVIGLMLILLFSLVLGWFPFGGTHSWEFAGQNVPHDLTYYLDYLKHLMLPVLTLTLASIGYTTRLVRSSMLSVLREDYILTARSKGLKERIVIYKHALRNAILPILTVIGLRIAMMLGGSPIIEKMFSWPGMGKYFVDAAFMRDYFSVIGTSLALALMILIANLVTDISYRWLDPRVKI